MMNKNIVVIGSSRGIGLEVVRQFSADENNTVWALSRFSHNETIFDNETTIHARKIDLASSQIAEEMKDILEEIGTVDILINNAGYLVNKPFSELTYQDILTSYQTNIIGVMLLTQEVVKYASKNGLHIVNISSMGGFQGTVKF